MVLWLKNVSGISKLEALYSLFNRFLCLFVKVLWLSLMVPACLLRRNQKERATLIHPGLMNLMIFIVGVVDFSWWVWCVPDSSFQKVEGMNYCYKYTLAMPVL